MEMNSANEYELFVDGYYDEKNNGLNTAALEKVADIQKRENPYNFFDNAGALFSDAWGHIINFDSYLIAFCGNTCRYGYFCYRSEKRFAFFPAFYFAWDLRLVCMFVMQWILRYTMYGILLMILSFTMYSFDYHLRKDEYSNITDKSRKTVLISVIVLVILSVASCASSIFLPYHSCFMDKKPSDLFILRLIDIQKIIMFSIL